MKTLLSVIVASFVLASVGSAAEPVNSVCPVCSKTVRLIFHSNFKGQRVAFATAECKDKFDKSPTKYSVKPK
jgi:YHS domain-containing protein